MFLTEVMKRKGNKNPILVYPGLRYTHKKLNFACKIFFFKKCLFEYENQFAVENKHKKMFGGNFKNTSPSKKCYSYIFPIWKLYD